MPLDLQPAPRKILMIKSHSVGIGDVLRSSAAWRALKKKWPDVELHLLFLTKHAGYPSEEFIRNHHLLSSVTFFPIRYGTPHDKKVKKVTNLKIIQQIWRLSKKINPDFVIDFEWTGTRTSLITWVATRAVNAKSLGIAEFPFRFFFYTYTARSKREYVSENKLNEPFDYTIRDFIVLKGLGIEREGIPIELRANPESIRTVQKMLSARTQRLRVGLNIGCATEGASHKRMDLHQLAQYFKAWQISHDIELYLTGAPNEIDINRSFIEILERINAKPLTLVDFAGKTDGKLLTALISQMDLFISTDSGPYHMAVALKIPTICWFTAYGPGSLHSHSWVTTLIQPTETEFLDGVRNTQYFIRKDET